MNLIKNVTNDRTHARQKGQVKCVRDGEFEFFIKFCAVICVCMRMQLLSKCCGTVLCCVVLCQRLQRSSGNGFSRLRTRDLGERSYTQNVTLKPTSVGRTLSG
jgi:hypothetical protein